MLKINKSSLDLRLIGLLGLFYTLLSVISFVKVAYLKTNGPYYQDYDWYTIIFKWYCYDWVLYMLFTILIIYTTKQMINKKIGWRYIITTHLLFSFVFGIFTYFGSLSISILTGDYDPSNLKLDSSLLNLVRNMDYNFVIYFATISVIYAYNYLNQIKQTQIQKLQLETLLTNTRIKILKSQLQPHFLFNALHSIHSLLDVDLDKSKKMIVDLSELLREIIDHKEELLIPLKEEVRLLDKYLSIIKIRFSEDLKVVLNYEQDIKDQLVPNMLLQPVVENSIKHGYSPNHIHLKLDINIFNENNYLIILITNNGKPLTSSYDDIINKGLGIKNTIDRLKILYNDDFDFEIFNDTIGVTTKITIPYQTKAIETSAH